MFMDVEFIITIVVLVVVFESVKVARKLKQEAAKQARKQTERRERDDLEQGDSVEKSHLDDWEAEDEQENEFYEVFPDEYDNLEMLSEEEPYNAKNENFKVNSSKSSSYFTYEDENRGQEKVQDKPSGNISTQQFNNLQNVDNEDKKKEINLQDPDELQKAILYSEILKNPYN